MFELNVSLAINSYVLDYDTYESIIKRYMVLATDEQKTSIKEYLCCLEVFELSLDSYRKDKRRNASVKDITYLNEKLHDFMACAYEYSLCYELTNKQKETILRVSLRVSERLTAAVKLLCGWGLKDD